MKICHTTWLLILVLCCNSFIAISSIDIEATLTEGQGFSTIPLTKTFVLKDATADLDIKDILKNEFQSQFQIAENSIKKIQDFDANYWIKFSFQKNTDPLRKIYLGTGDWTINYFDCYVVGADGTIKSHFETGLFRPFKNRDLFHKNFNFLLPSLEGTSTVYLKIKSNHKAFFNFHIRSLEHIQQASISEEMVLGLFYGMLLLLAIINLTTFLAIGQKINLWYFIYELSCILLCLNIDGLGFLFLWPDLPILNHVLIKVVVPLQLFAVIQYSSAFLSFKSSSTPAKKLQYLVLAFAVLAAFFVTNPLTNFVVGISSILVYLLIIYEMRSSYKKGFYPAKYFLTAISISLVGLICLWVMKMGFIPWDKFNRLQSNLINYAYNIALITEFAIFLFAQVLRYKYRSDNQRRLIEGNEKRFRNIFEGSFDAILVFDSKLNKVIDNNETAQNLFNYSHKELLKIPIDRIIDLPLELNTKMESKNGWNDEHQKSIQITGLTKANKNINLALSISKLDSEDNIYILAIKDITEQVIAQKELDNKMEEITNKNRQLEKYIASNNELESFAYVASHDMKQPIRSIKSFSQLLERKLKKENLLDQTKSEYLDFIINGISDMEKLVSDLLDHSKVNSMDDLHFKKASLEDVVLRVKFNLTSQLIENKSEIIYSNLPTLFIEQTRIQQLFQNIISNAVKFRKKNENCTVEIIAKELKEHWQISIQDNGIGIEKEYFDEIFQIFRKLHGRAEYAGSGIGLATCKKIVEQHGGRIWVESTLDVGTTFHFTLLKNIQQKNMLKTNVPEMYN